MAKTRGLVVINSDRCKGCGLCTVACPPGIISLDATAINIKGYQPAVVRDMKKCIGCGNCAIVCPDVAITVERLDRMVSPSIPRDRSIKTRKTVLKIAAGGRGIH
jgi:2-oxoglutarate ferredoxin oxidoreductase subunit delta